jgi:DNA anti-recombination protein RmuC
MESSNEIFPIVETNVDYCQNPVHSSPCHARQYLMCPHCSFHLCFEHAQQHQKQIQNETFNLYNRAKNLENLLINSQPVQTVIEQALNSLNEWRQKMHHFIDQYTQQIQIHIERAQNRLDDQWNTTKKEYLHMLDQFVTKPVDQLLQGLMIGNLFR